VSGLILAACLTWSAGADEPLPAPVSPEAPTAADGYRADLERAKALWFRGESEPARAELQRLYYRAVAGEPVPLALAGEAAIYLGEVELDAGRSEDAEAAWRWLLTRDPGFPISPYQHPIEVIGQFEIIRRQVRESLPPELPPVRPRYPAWGYAPFGIPQLRQGRPVRGGLYLGAQVVLATASLGLFADLVLANPARGERWPADHPYAWPDTDATERLLDRKYLLQWPATFGFYGLWVVSILDGQATFRADGADRGAAGPVRLPVGIAGRW
jgi:hypothetical protein